MPEFRNTSTGRVQRVPEGSLLHRLVEANPEMYEPTAEEKPDAPRKPRRRGSSSGSKPDRG